MLNIGKWKTKTKATKTGAQIEQLATEWLQQRGLQLLENNYRCREGEIDIIMLDGQSLVFVEVRYRNQSCYGSSLESVDWRKQKKLLKAAAHYLLVRSQHANRACRFDVLAVQPSGKTTLQWHWIENAFTA